MRKFFSFLLTIVFCIPAIAQTFGPCCDGGERYSKLDLNLDKVANVGDTSYIYQYSNKRLGYWILEQKHDNIYFFRSDVKTTHTIRVRYDTSNRIELYHYYFNSGWAGSGSGTGFEKYYENGNLRVDGELTGKRTAVFSLHDTLSAKKCYPHDLPFLGKFRCIRKGSRWFVYTAHYTGKFSELKPRARRKFFRDNRENFEAITISWKDGFKIDDELLARLIAESRIRSK